MKPTQEQQTILEAVHKHRVLKVNAVAGSGKSSTLRMIAEANKVKSIYMCFNKSIQLEAEAKFPKHVLCRTTHALAYAKFGVALQHKSKVEGTIAGSASQIVQYFGIEPYTVDESSISARAIGAMVKTTVDRFENSANDQVSNDNLPWRELNTIKKQQEALDLSWLSNYVLSLSKKLWILRCDPRNKVRSGFNTYLKLWQLSKPQLDCEILYVDEAQDTNPAVLDVIKNQQHCKVIYVGDSFQSIYAFRQAMNAMENVEAPSYELTKSFRYGPDIAELAKFIISDAIDVKGLESIDSKITLIAGKPNAKYTKIFRTNSALIEDAVFLISEGARVKCNIDVGSFKENLIGAENLYLQNNKKVDGALAMFDTWDEVKEASEEDGEIKRLVDIVESGKTHRYLKALTVLTTGKGYYDVFMTTAHKSKGMEWDSVVIADDFPSNTILKETDEEGFNQQEVNLFYVACTRAIRRLQLPLDFYKEYIKYEV